MRLCRSRQTHYAATDVGAGRSPRMGTPHFVREYRQESRAVLDEAGVSGIMYITHSQEVSLGRRRARGTGALHLALTCVSDPSVSALHRPLWVAEQNRGEGHV